MERDRFWFSEIGPLVLLRPILVGVFGIARLLLDIDEKE